MAAGAKFCAHPDGCGCRLLRVFLDHHRQTMVVCNDPGCRWRDLPAADHLDRHNRVCAELFVGRNGEQCLCELSPGHDPPHRGEIRKI